MSDIKIKNWRLPYTTQEKATATDDYLAALSLAKNGFYPMGANELWHGGIHLSDNVINVLGGDTLGCIADGEVIAYRIDKQYPTADYGDFKSTFSSGFTLVKHVLGIPKPPAKSATATKNPSTQENAATDNAESEKPNNDADNAAGPADLAPANSADASSDNDSSALSTDLQTDGKTSTAENDINAEGSEQDGSAIPPDVTPPDKPTATPQTVDKPAATLNLYSLYMHLSDWKSYQDNPELVRPGYWQSDEYAVGDKANDGVRGCRVREKGPKTAVLAILPRGTQVKVGNPVSKAAPNWRKLTAIVSGESLPTLTDEPLPGYVYIREMTPSPHDKTLFTVEDRGNDKSETEKGINIRKSASAANDAESWLSWLPRGSRILIGERSPNGKWGKIETILEGVAYPELPKDNDDKLQGWVYLEHLEEQPAKPAQTNDIVILDPPCPIKTGELIGYPGQNQEASDALEHIPPSLLTHIELFSCDDLPAIIEQSRSQWKSCAEEYKTHVVINQGATLHRPIDTDRQINAQIELEKLPDSKTFGPWTEVREKARTYSVIIARGQLGGRIKPNATDVYGGYRVNQTQKEAILSILTAQGETLKIDDIPDSVKFAGVYHHNTDDRKTELYVKGVEKAPTGYGRRYIVFSAVQTEPTFWVKNDALNETGNRSDLDLTLNGWIRFPLQKGQNSLENRIGFCCLIDDSNKKDSDLNDKQKAQNHSENIAADSDGKRWHYVNCVDENGRPIAGWVKEETPDAVRYAPWEWPLFDLVAETATPKQQADRMNRGATLDEADRTPLMKALYDKIDINNDQRLAPSELQQALKKPWLATQLSRLIVNYESEWFADEALSKWIELDDWLKDVRWKAASDDVKAQFLAYWQADKTQHIKKLLWWDKLAGQHGLSKNGKAWYFHPVGMVGNFGKVIMERSTLLTVPLLMKLQVTKANAEKYVDALNQKLTEYDMASELRVGHFISQLITESGYLRYTKEIIDGKEPSYSPYIGRGLIQLTWKSNYEQYGKFVNENVSSGTNYTKLESLPHSVTSAIWFWKIFKKLNNYADIDDLIWISYVINGGFNGYNHRLSALNKFIEQTDSQTLFKNNHNGIYKFEESNAYNNIKASFAWGLWNDVGNRTQGIKYKSKEEALKGYKRFISLHDETGKPALEYYKRNARQHADNRIKELTK